MNDNDTTKCSYCGDIIPEGQKFWINQSISINKYEVTNVKFKKLKEVLK